MRDVVKILLRYVTTVLFANMIITGTASAEKDSLDQVDIRADIAEEIAETPGNKKPKKSKRRWTLNLGLVGGFSPEYEGSNDYDFETGPSIAFSWRDIIFYKGKTLGANLIRQKSLKAGPIISWTSGRNDDDNDKLNGLGDIDGSIEAGGFISYKDKPLRFRLEVQQDINSGHEGALVELSGGSTLPRKKPFAFVSLGTTWASDNYMESFYGVNAQQSIASGMPIYKTDAGIKDINFALTAGYSVTKRWRIGGKLEYKILIGDAADSPIVEDKNQFLAGLSLSYHMGSKFLPEELQ